MNRMMPLPGKVRVEGDVHQPLPHESAFEHVSGRAVYIDDMLEPAGTLHGYFGLSLIAKGALKRLDLAKVREAEGVIDVLTHEDIPGSKFNNPTGKLDDPYLVQETIDFLGQALFFVVAETREQARDAAMLAVVKTSEEAPARTIDEALAADYPMVTEPLTLKIGDSEKALSSATNRLQGSIEIGGQDHFYLEGHIAFAMPGEGEDVTVFSSTQHPSEVQHMVAHALHVSSANVTVEVRRMGGGFGGKETQSNAFAVLAAIAAKKLNRPVKVRPDRDDDMIMTGKRHDFKVDYDVAFDDRGVIEGFEADLAARCGFSADLSGPVTDRALFHIDNCYYLPNTKVSSKPLKTNTVSNTAFRGFGGPQGLVAGERVLEEIAYKLGVDPLEIRKRNFYRDDCDVTPYHQKVEDNIIGRLVEELEASSDYQKRREAILAFNKENRVLKKGIALSPVKFGISFTATWYNQAGALIHVYQDGSVQLNHGGTEMGQGLYTKVAQVVANAFQIDISKIRVTATTTGKVPNTSATAASSGADLNAMAALNAAEKIKARLVAFAAEKYGVTEASVSFLPGMVKVGETTLSFAELVHEAYMARVQLSDTGFYKTPDIHWDRASGKGRPFYYFAYGAAASEVMIDTLTGEYQVMRADVLHDVGKSLNPALDKGQVEGAFVQGMGWLTTEELWWDDKGALKTHAPSTYKIPLASDVPPIFNVELASWSENPERTIKRSKAVGEPPFCLAYSVLEALSMAVASVADYRHCPRLDAPATPERVLMAVKQMKAAL